MKVHTLKTISYQLDNKPKYNVIFLHGLGANPDDLRPVAQALALAHVRFVLPYAPMHPITINQGYAMPAWYDIKSLGFLSSVYSDEKEVDQGCHLIKALIADEQAKYGIAASHTFLMGFSQGGSMALEIGLHSEDTFAGIIGLSTLPAKNHKTFENLSKANQNTPLFLAHGTKDSVIPFDVGHHTQTILKEKLYPVTWVTGEEEHTLWPQEITELRQWFSQIIKNKL